MVIDRFAKRPYSIINHDPSWSKRFRHIEKRLRTVFVDKATGIFHIGSTAVPNLIAKPVIDILLTVREMESFEKEKSLLEKEGYVWEENYIGPETLTLVRETSGSRRLENIHVCKENSVKALQFIYVTEYLSAHPEAAMAYGELKQKLFREYPDDYPAYRATKQNFLQKIYKLAYQEKGLEAPDSYPDVWQRPEKN